MAGHGNHADEGIGTMTNASAVHEGVASATIFNLEEIDQDASSFRIPHREAARTSASVASPRSSAQMFLTIYDPTFDLEQWMLMEIDGHPPHRLESRDDLRAVRYRRIRRLPQRRETIGHLTDGYPDGDQHESLRPTIQDRT